MSHMPTANVRTAMDALSLLNAVSRQLRYLVRCAVCSGVTNLNEFATMEAEIRTMHTGIMEVLTDINVSRNDVLHLGLRLDEDSWSNPPETTLAAVREVRNLLNHIGTLVNTENRRNVPGYSYTFEVVFGGMLSNFRLEAARIRGSMTADDDLLLLDSDDDVFEEVNVVDDANGAPDRVTTFIATDGEESGVCIICLEQFQTGEEIRTLACTHCFHSQCIAQWLRTNATCPIDRSSIA